ncbi:hypothetical protein OAL00_01290 [Verrucomicrobiales bacterium]|nr:hypothetical protein [Verrucomicrobiales bacterium]
MQTNGADPCGAMQRMMKGLTVCFAILMIAGSSYVGSYVYLRETRAIKIGNPVSYDFLYGEPDEWLQLIYSPLIWLDEKLTGTTICFVEQFATIFY